MGSEGRPLLLPWPELARGGPELVLSVPRREWLVARERLVRRLWLADIEAHLPARARVLRFGARPAVRSAAALHQRLSDAVGSAAPATPVIALVEDGEALMADEQSALWGLRALLSERAHLHLFAASAVLPQALVDYDAPFLEFFTLQGAAGAERHLAGLLPALPGPEASVAHQLLGGGLVEQLAVARATRLAPPTAPDLLLTALDLMAPGLEAQVEALSSQAQDLFAVVGASLVALTGAQVASVLALSPGVVSGQLRRLVQAGVLIDVANHDEVTGKARRRIAFGVRRPALALWALSQRAEQRRAVRGWAALAEASLVIEALEAPGEVPDLASVHPEALAMELRARVATAVRAAPSRWSAPWRREPQRFAAWAPALALGWGTHEVRGLWCEPVRRGAALLGDRAARAAEEGATGRASGSGSS